MHAHYETILTFTTYVHRLARTLPPAYVEQMVKEYGAPVRPEDEIPDIEVEVSYRPGWHQPARLLCHPDNATPAEGEDAEVTKVVILDGKHDITELFDQAALRELSAAAWEDQQQQAEDAADYDHDYDPADDYDDDQLTP